MVCTYYVCKILLSLFSTEDAEIAVHGSESQDTDGDLNSSYVILKANYVLHATLLELRLKDAFFSQLVG